MKKYAVFLTFLLAASLSWAQAPAVGALPDGLTLRVEVMKDVQSKKASVGDPVQLEVVADAKDSTGRVIIAKKTKLTGKVTEAQSFDKKAGREARLSILVTSAGTPSGPVAVNGIMFGKFQPPARLAPVGISAAGEYHASDAPASKAESATSVSQALRGVELKPDPKLGSVMVSKEKNIVLESGLQFDLKHVMPVAQPQPPVQQ